MHQSEPIGELAEKHEPTQEEQMLALERSAASFGNQPPAIPRSRSAARSTRRGERHGTAYQEPGHSWRTGPPPTVALASAKEVLDGQIANLVTQPIDPARRREFIAELAYLATLRRSVDACLDNIPTDVVLSEAIVEFAQDVTQIVADLCAGGEVRMERLLTFTREVINQVRMLASRTPEAERLKANAMRFAAEARGREDAIADALVSIADVFQEARAFLETKERHTAPSTLIDLLVASDSLVSDT